MPTETCGRKRTLLGSGQPTHELCSLREARAQSLELQDKPGPSERNVVANKQAISAALQAYKEGFITTEHI